jgi:hypothetical protein
MADQSPELAALGSCRRERVRCSPSVYQLRSVVDGQLFERAASRLLDELLRDKPRVVACRALRFFPAREDRAGALRAGCFFARATSARIFKTKRAAARFVLNAFLCLSPAASRQSAIHFPYLVFIVPRFPVDTVADTGLDWGRFCGV